MRNIDDYNIADLEMALTSGTEETNTPPTSLSLDDVPIRDLEQAYALQKMKPQGGGPVSKEPEQSGARYLAEQFAKGAIDLADFMQLITKFGAHVTEAILPEGSRKKFAERANVPYVDHIKEMTEERPYSETIQNYLKEKGVNLNTQEAPDDRLLRIAGHGARAAPVGLTSILGGPAALASGLGFATATGVGSGVLQEAGVNPLIADLASVVAVPGAALGIKKLATPSLPSLSGAEKKVGNYLKSKIGEKELPEVSRRLKNPPVYKKSNYVPTTAEVAESSILSQLNRLRYESPGSGLPEHIGAQNDQLRTTIDKMLPSNSQGVDIRGALEDKVKSLKKIRREATEEGYKELSKDNSLLNPKNAKKYLRESKARGDIKKDLGYAREQIKPTKKEKILGPEDIENIGEYFVENLSPTKREALGFSSKINKNSPTVSDLVEGRKAINARLKKRMKTPGNEEQVMELKNVITELDKDLSKIPLHEKIVKTYKELSEPISHINQHPGLKKVLKTRLNNQITSIMDTNSSSNISALKKAVGKDKSLWKEIRESITDNFTKSIKNAGAEGKGVAFSQPKFKKYLEKHGKTLKEIYTKEQMELVNETGQILRGQNIAKTLGAGPGSPTFSRLTTDLGFKEATGIKKAAEIATSGKTKKGISSLINNWSNGNQEKIFSVLDRALREPEFAHKLISYNPKNQVEFNRFLNQSLRQAPLLVKGNNEERGDDELR
jgi:hypothetical protein